MRRRLLATVAALAVTAAAVFLAVRFVIGGASRGYSNAYGNAVVHYELRSRLLGRTLSEVAIVPPGRERRGLLVLMHGRDDPGPLSWLVPEQTGPETVLSNQLLRGVTRLGRQAPVVVILNGGGHSYYHDRQDGPWGSMILDEAIPDAVRRFGVVPGRIAIGGISMGGYGALYLAGLRPGRFCAVGGHSAALWLSPSASAPGAFDDSADFLSHDVFAEAREGRFDQLPVWIDGGASDPFRAADAALVGLLRSRHVTVTYHVWPGAHTHAYWASHMAAYLGFYARALATCGDRGAEPARAASAQPKRAQPPLDALSTSADPTQGGVANPPPSTSILVGQELESVPDP